jgi:hypothetical protein
MKSHIKSFTEFIKESDILSSLGLGDDSKDKEGSKDKEEKKEDPILKLQKIEKKKEEKKDEKFDEFMEKRLEKIKSILDKYKEINDEVGKKVIDAVKSRDRIALHNVTNELIYLQVKYEKAGDIDAVHQITAIKTIVDDLDHSYTNNTRI